MMNVDQTRKIILEGIARGQHPGAQAYVWRDGSVLLDESFGEVRSDTLVPWRSAGKPLTAVAIAQLWERGQLELDDPVARFLPDFAQRGKQAVTIRHLLTHTAGFRGLPLSTTAKSFDDMLRQVMAMRLEADWLPGKKAGYHIASSWYVLGAIVRAIDGRPIEQFVREQILAPLGMNDTYMAMPPDTIDRYGERIAALMRTDVSPPRPAGLDTGAHLGIANPGASLRGPIRQLGRFYTMLLQRGVLDDARVLSSQAVEALTARHRTGMYDETFKHVMDWGLGFIVNSSQYGAEMVPYGFGKYASPRTFGHGGSQCCVGAADPENRLVVAIAWTGQPGEPAHQARLRATMDAVYGDSCQV
jgi:CubicO group peptidase (beta-lactamase class C family)